MKHRSGLWLSLAVVLLVIGILVRQPPLVLVAAMLLLIELVSWVWERYGLTGVTYHRRLSANRVFCGEEVQIEVEIHNRKPLPLPWIELLDEVPTETKMLTGKALPSSQAGRMELTHYFPMAWYEKVTRRYRVQCPQRGVYTFGPARATVGDLLGLRETETIFPETDTLIVYPRVLPLDKPGIPSAQLLGEIRTRGSLHQDPILTVGVRDYSSGDSLKHIHWKTSARTGHLSTKVYEPTTSMDMCIFLDVRTTIPPMIGNMPHLTELGIIACASLCYRAAEDGFRVGLYINEWRFRPGEVVRVPPGRSTGQMPLVLEHLARIQPLPNECVPMGTLVLNESAGLPWGSTVVVISAAPTEGLLSALVRVKRAGRAAALIVVGDAAVPLRRNGLGVYRVPDDLLWNELQSVPVRVA